jgi:hypothetical protein
VQRPGQKTIEGMSHADLAQFVHNILQQQTPDKAGSYEQVDVHGVLNVKDKLNLSAQAQATLLQGVATTSFVTGRSPKITTSVLSGGPPGSPSDGDIWIATAVDANGTRWHFQYNAGSASAYKWEFLGGPPINYYKPSSTTDTITSIQPTFANLPTTGTAAELLVPRAGDYFADLATRADGFGAADWTALAIKLGAAAASTSTAIFVRGNNFVNVFNRFKFTGLTASEVLLLQAATTTSGGRIFEISFSLHPVRVS